MSTQPMTFSLSGADFQGIRSLGSGSPEDGYYRATIESVTTSDKKADARVLNLRFESGFTCMYFLHLPAPLQPGQTMDMLSKDDQKTRRGRIGAFRSVLDSLGYAPAVIDNPQSQITDQWFVHGINGGRGVYVEWVAGVGDEYGEVQAFLTQADYEARIASGTKPVKRARPDRQGAAGTPGGWQPGATPGAAPAPQGASGAPQQGWAPQGAPQQAPQGWAPQGAPQQAPQGWAPQGAPNGAPPQQQWGGQPQPVAGFPSAPPAPR